MLESLVASILNRVLGNYVSNLNYDQLKIAIWSGQVHLHNLKLRRDALDKLHLPIDVTEGYLGELELSIPWSNLKAQPVKVHIRNVYLLAKPKSESTINLAEEEERAQRLKQQKLETAELLDASKSSSKQGKEQEVASSSSGGFVNQLLTKVVDNLQFVMENIHIRYEDHLSCPDAPFAVGVTLKELSAVSTDGNWVPSFIGEFANTIHKLLKLESLSVYWNTNAKSLSGLSQEEALETYTKLIPTTQHEADANHQYLIKPVSGTGKIKLNKVYGKEVAKVDATLLFDELAFSLDNEQYRDALLLVDLFHANLKKQEFLKFHPPAGVTPRSDPKGYFRFAGQAVLSKIHERNHQWTWEHFKTRRDQRLAYVDVYYAVKQNKATQLQKNTLKELERALSFEDIRFYRSIVKAKLRKDRIRLEEEKQKNASKGGWFSSWWSSAPATAATNDGDDASSIVMTDEQKKELYDAIGYDEDVAAMENAIDLPKDTMKFIVRTRLNRGSFQLWQNPHQDKHQLTSVVFESVAAKVTQFVESTMVAASLGDLQLFDGMTKGTLYPQLIGVKKTTASGKLSLLRDGEDEATSEPFTPTTSEPFLSIVYERKPLHKKADSAIKVAMRHLEVIYNPQVILGVLRFLKEPNSNSESFDALVQVAGSTFEGFKRQTLAGLEYALERHTTMDLDIEIDAPLIIVPESVLTVDSPVLILDAGHIHVDSDLANQELAQELKQRRVNSDDYERLESLMYDKFNVSLSQMKLLIGRHVKQCVAQLAMDEGAIGSTHGDNAYLVQRIDIQFLVERCILPSSYQYTQIKVSGQLPHAAINFSTQKYKTLMRIIDLLLPPSGDDDADRGDQPQQQQDQEQAGTASVSVPVDANDAQSSALVSKNLLAQQLWGDHERSDIVLSDHESEMTASVSSGPSKSVVSLPTDIARSQRENFRFSFHVGKVNGYLYDSGLDAKENRLICEIKLSDFGLELINRPYDMVVQVRLKSFDVLDKTPYGKDFVYLVTSDPSLAPDQHGSKEGEQEEQEEGTSYLVDVRYERANRAHPRFQELFGGYEQSVHVKLSTLTIIATRESVLTLYNWVMTTFTGGNEPPHDLPDANDDEKDDQSSTHSRPRSYLSNRSKQRRLQQQLAKQQQQQQQNASAGSIRVNIHLVSVQLILNEQGTRLGTGTLTFGYVEILVFPKTLQVSGKFGNFVLTDDSTTLVTIPHDEHDASSPSSAIEKIKKGKSDVLILSIEGDDLLNFTYATHDPRADDFQGYHQHIHLRMGAFRLTFTDAFKNTLDFLSQFLAMKGDYDKMRENAAVAARQIVQSPSATFIRPKEDVPVIQETEQEPQLFHFDVVIKSPIVDFPVTDKTTVSAHLGEIRAKNEFVTILRPHVASGKQVNVRVNQIKCGLYAISLQSLTKGDGDGLVPMLADVDVDLTIESQLASPASEQQDDTFPIGAATCIRGKVTNVLLQLTEHQYAWLLQIQQKLMSTFFAPADKEDDRAGNEQHRSDSRPPSPSILSSESVHSLMQGAAPPMITTSTASPSRLLASPSLENPPRAKVQLDLCVDIQLVCLEVFHVCNETTVVPRADASLCRFSFDGSQVKLQTRDGGALLLEAQVQSVNFYDTRKDSKSHFRDFLPAGKHLAGPQFQLQYRQAPNNAPVVTVAVDKPQLVLSLDYIMLLKDFFIAPFQGPPAPTPAQTYAASFRRDDTQSQQQQQQQQQQQSVEQQDSGKPLQFKVNVVDVEILCLLHADSASSEALVLSMDHLHVSQTDQLALHAKGISAILCRMNRRQESSLTLLEPFDAEIAMETSPTLPGHQITSVNANVDPIILRLSYHNLMLILDIINKVTALLDRDQHPHDPNHDHYNAVDTTDGMPSQHLALAMASQDQRTASRAATTDDRSNAPDPSTTRTTIEPYIVMSRESLNATFDGFQLVIVEDMYSLPFLDLAVQPFSLTASDWSHELKASVSLTMLMNNFNVINSHWEPLLDPYSVNLNLTQDSNTKQFTFKMTSADLLNLNISHAFLQSILTVSATLSQSQPLPETKQQQLNPYMLRNRTGYDLRFWNMSSDADAGKTAMQLVKNGEDCKLSFRDWKKHREILSATNNCLGVQVLHKDWQSIHSIPVDMEGTHSYRLIGKKPLDVPDRLVVGVSLENHVKSVTFHSGITVRNDADAPIQYAMVNAKRRFVSKVWTLEPKESLYVPIDLCYRPWIVMRPSDAYHWSSDKIHWSDLVHPNAPSILTCKPYDEHMADFSYHLHAHYDAKDPVAKQYPVMDIHVGAPLKIVNLLPFDFKWTMVNQHTNQHEVVELKNGESHLLYSFTAGSPLSFVMDIQHDDYEPTSLKQMQWKPAEMQEGYPLPVKDKYGNTLQLFMHVSHTKKSKHAAHVRVYCPYLILNKVGYPITVRAQDSNFGYKSVTATHQIPQYDDRVTPHMFSYQSIDKANRAQISVNGSKWSKALSFEAVGSSVDICVPYDNTKEMHAGIHVEEGTGKYNMTKFVIVTPRFVLRNYTDLALKYAEYHTTDATSIGVHDLKSLYLTQASRPFKWLWLQLEQNDNLWSTPFDIHEVGTSYVKVPPSSNRSERMILIKVSVHINNSTIFVTLHRATEWPYVILNKSSTEVTIFQETPEHEGHLGSGNFRPSTYKIQPGDRFEYSWDLPASKDRRLVLQVGKRRRAIDFLAIGSQVPFRYKKHQSLSIDVAAHNSALQLRLTDYRADASLFRPTMGSSESTTIGSSRESTLEDHFETVTINLVDNYSVHLQLRGIGISLVNKRCQEVLYATIKNVDLKYTDSNLYQSIRASIQWVQIDNQLFNSAYPILFFPSNLPKRNTPDAMVHPTFHLALDKVKDTSHGVQYFKLFSVLLQEMTFEMDEDLLYALMEFAQFDVKGNTAHDDMDATMFSANVQAPDEDDTQALLYFEEFCMQPMRLNLSFVRTARVSTEETETSNSPLSYIFNVLTMTIGNVNDAPVKLNALIVENLRASSSDLSSRILLHYQEEVIYQIHKVVGSADLIGNPVGLFSNLSSGFGELFYEPYQGFITSDRPQDLGLGLARGVGGFMKKSVFGFTDSFSRFTGSIGKGLAMATMDKSFQERRHMRLTRNKPQHALYGVTQGVTSFGTSIASGVTGLVEQPRRGAEQGGVGGFVSGVGKGLIGAVTKPMVGIFDLASNVSAGIRETTNMFDGSELVRERLPRLIPRDGILRSYNQREALGQLWLKELADGKLSHESYIAHSMTKQGTEALIVTYQSLVLVSLENLSVLWRRPLDLIDSVEWRATAASDAASYLTVHMKQTTASPDGSARTETLTGRILFEEASTGPWFASQVQHTLSLRREEKSRL